MIESDIAHSVEKCVCQVRFFRCRRRRTTSLRALEQHWPTHKCRKAAGASELFGKPVIL